MSRVQPPPLPDSTGSKIVQYPVTQTNIWLASHLAKHFSNLAKLGGVKYFGAVALELLVMIHLSAMLLDYFHASPRTSLNSLSDAMLIVVVTVIAPFFETFLVQVAIGELTRFLKFRFWWQVVAMTIAFALVHVMEGLATVLCAGLVGGFFFGFTYACRRNISFSSAYWTTALLHFLNNAVATTIFIIMRHQGQA